MYWLDGTAVDAGYTNYYEPFIDGGDQDALYLSSFEDWQWGDLEPAYRFFVLCEIDI